MFSILLESILLIQALTQIISLSPKQLSNDVHKGRSLQKL